MPKLKPFHPVKQPAPHTETTPAPPAPTPQPVREASAAPSGRWRVQLGAFGDQSKAQLYGEELLAKEHALEPYKFYLVNAGSVTRLQVGPLASKADAERLCGTLKARGQACLIVNP